MARLYSKLLLNHWGKGPLHTSNLVVNYKVISGPEAGQCAQIICKIFQVSWARGRIIVTKFNVNPSGKLGQYHLM